MNSHSLKADPVSFNWVKDWIELHTGIVFPEHKAHILANRLESLCARMNIRSFSELVNLIQTAKDDQLIQKIIDVATTNHTHFFRETNSIDYFIHEIVPSFNHGEPFRIWSAASSSGEELYTIILKLCETHLISEISRKFSFLGTDVNPSVIEQAEKAVYSSLRLTEVPDTVKEKWFRAIGLGSWKLKEEVSSLCLFRRLNLLDYPWPFANLFHVVFLRNILYYFDAKIQQKILNQIYDVSLPGAWLITSVTESFSNLNVKWKRVEAGIYRKQEF